MDERVALPHDLRSDRHAASVCSSAPMAICVFASVSHRFSARTSLHPCRAFSAAVGQGALQRLVLLL